MLSKIDLRPGYYQIRVKTGEISKIALKICYGHYEYSFLPFSLSNAPGVFMEYMNNIFSPLLGSVCCGVL